MTMIEAKSTDKNVKRQVYFNQEEDFECCNPRDWSDDTKLISIDDYHNDLRGSFHKTDPHHYDEETALEDAKTSGHKYFQLLKLRYFGGGESSIDEESAIWPIEEMKDIEEKDFNMIMLGMEEADIQMAVEYLQQWVSGQVYMVYAIESKKCGECGDWSQETVDSVGGIFRCGSHDDLIQDLWSSAKDAFNVADQWDLSFNDVISNDKRMV